MYQVSQLYIYPVKSLGGIALNTSSLTSRGLKYDRRWMLIDANNRFLSQREHAQMALFKTHLAADGIKVTYTPDGESTLIPFNPLLEQTTQVIIWDDTCTGTYVSGDADKWFSQKLNIVCRLVYMTDDSYRPTDPRYTTNTITSFSDAYPLLMIGQASLDDLNSRLDKPLGMDRFRPNIVFTGGLPYEEDSMQHIRINDINLYGVKLCARCVMTTINQDTTKKSKEPLKTLASYRLKNNKIMFGQNVVTTNEGVLSIGDTLEMLALQTEERFTV